MCDFARRVFERPVATEGGGTRLVGRRRDLRGRELGQRVDKGLPGRARGDIATVQQDIRIRGERTGNHLQVGGTREQCIRGIRTTTEHELAVGTVADDRNGSDVGQFGQRLRDLGQAVLGRIQTHNQRRRIGLRDELLPALDRRIHKHHNTFRHFGRGTGRQRGRLGGFQKFRGVVQRLLRVGELFFGRQLLGVNLLDLPLLGEHRKLRGGHE